jgi:RNA polymerase sigma factor (sigma-70 family)
VSGSILLADTKLPGENTIMATTTQAGAVLRHLRGLMAADGAGPLGDRQLLERFTAGHDEAAFAALLKRHGPMVHGVCRRVLRDAHDAEDAFQATFLVLASRAGTIGKADSVGGWLYQVAYNTALKARASAAARRRREQRTGGRPHPDPLAEVTGRELLSVLDGELHRLPERQRAPLVLCYLEGLTRDEAAVRLGFSESTLKRRLEEGREQLRRRLERRGLALSAALLTAGVSGAAVSSSLGAATVAAGLAVASGGRPAVSAGVASLLRAMTAGPRKAVAAVLVAATVLATGAVLLAHRAPAAAGGHSPPAAEAPKAKPEVRPAAPAAADKQETTYTVVVLGANGKPVPGARVAAVTNVEPPYRGRVGYRDFEATASRETDKDGRARLTLTAAPADRPVLRQVIASAPGHGLGWQLLPGGEKDDIVVKLSPEQVIRGHLIDLQGQPAKGVKLHVANVAREIGGATGTVSTMSGVGSSTSATLVGGPPLARGESEWPVPAAHSFATAPARLDAWPAGVTTDADGKFEVRGLGRDRTVTLLVTDERFAYQRLVVRTAQAGKPEAFEKALEPAHWLEGKVVGEDTGKPIGKKVLLEISARGGPDALQVWADEKGEFRANCPPGDFFIEPYAPDGSPYLTRAQFGRWPKGQVKHEVEVKLPRGVLVRGKVVEAGTDRPVAGAVVSYFIREDNPLARYPLLSWRRFPGEYVRTREDGTFEAAVYPGKGTLLARGPTRDYVLERLDSLELAHGRPGGAALYVHTAAPLDLKAEGDCPAVALKLRRGVTVKGRVLDPDGKPVKSALIYHYLSLANNPNWAWSYYYNLEPVAVKDGAFALTGLDPKAKLAVCVIDRANLTGAQAVLSAEPAAKDVEIKLQPCATAKARFADPASKRLAGHGLMLDFRLDAETRVYLQQSEALGGWDAAPHSDKEGRVTMPGLIPGTTYRYYDGKKLREFTAESGKTHDLGELAPPMGGGGSAGSQ